MVCMPSHTLTKHMLCPCNVHLLVMSGCRPAAWVVLWCIACIIHDVNICSGGARLGHILLVHFCVNPQIKYNRVQTSTTTRTPSGPSFIMFVVSTGHREPNLSSCQVLLQLTGGVDQDNLPGISESCEAAGKLLHIYDIKMPCYRKWTDPGPYWPILLHTSASWRWRPETCLEV